MIFNSSQAGLSSTVLCVVFKIVYKAVEKHLGGGISKVTWKTSYVIVSQI